MSILKSGGLSRSQTAAIVSGVVGAALWVASAVVRSNTETQKKEFDSELERRLREARDRFSHHRNDREGN